MNSYYKYRSIPKSSFYNINILILPINTTEKYLKYFIHFCLCLRPPAIMNLIFRTVRLKNFMTSCRDKLYQHTISNKINFNFLIILFGKMSSKRNSVNDLASSNDVTINDVNGRIGNKTW